MKIQNLRIFVCAALVCGAFCCVQAEAKVCFAGDGGCGNISEFPEVPEVDTEKDCVAAGFSTSAASCNNPGGVCPYDSNYVKCCPAAYAYQACLYPLETVSKGDGVDKCGDLYKCKCPSDYKVSAEFAAANNCQPGGSLCLVNDGVQDKAWYKNCDCNASIYTDSGTTCSNGQSIASSCTDSSGNVRKKCYCNRSIYPYASCEYGYKGSRCVDSNSKREYYSNCKTAIEKCREDGYLYNECSKIHNCRSVNGKVSYTCVLGPACPYPVNPALYKCVFDKGSYCVGQGYNMTSTVKLTENSSCTTTDGFKGTVKNCSENDDYSLFYYKCKLPCKQEVIRAYSQGYLQQDTSITNKNGVVGYVRAIGTEKHLYITEDVVLPKTAMNTMNGGWANIGNKVDYNSINGMFALYDLDSNRFESCGEERENYYNRPKIKFDGMMINRQSLFLNKNMSDIDIEIYSSNSDSTSGYGEIYRVASNSVLTWKNISFSESGSPSKLCVGGANHSSKVYYGNQTDGACDPSFASNLIVLGSGSVITFTGTPNFQFYGRTYGDDKYKDYYKGSSFPITYNRFYTEKGAKMIFQNATIVSSSTMDFDGGNNGVMLFYNSTGTMGRVWSTWAIGLKNSKITFDLLRIQAYPGSSGWFSGYSTTWQGAPHARYRCHGVYVEDSTLTLRSNYGQIGSNNAKIFLDNSTLISAYPIALGGVKSDTICIDYWSNATINGKSYRGQSTLYGWAGTMVGSTAFYSSDQDEWYGRWYTGCANDKCSSCWYTNGYCKFFGGGGNSYCQSDDGYNTTFYPGMAPGSSSKFCTACDACDYGMGY